MNKTVLLVAVDQGVNLKKLREMQKLGRIELQQVGDIEQQWKDVAKHGQPFTIGTSMIGGPDMIAGDNVSKVKSMFGKNQYKDFLHIYSGHQIQADYFITGDKTDFIADGRREKLETMMPGLRIRTTNEFFEEIGDKT